MDNPAITGHTVTAFDDEISNLVNQLMEMGGLAKKQLQKSLKALRDEDLELARKVLHRERRLNQLEVKIDASVALLISRRQPVASDLRLVMSISKSVVDLERIGDEARKIAKLALKFYDGIQSPPHSSLLRDVYVMSRLTQDLLADALECLASGDADEALIIARSGEELHNAFSDALRRLSTFMIEDARSIGLLIDVIFLLKALERIGDHAMNLAEYVVYALKGEDIRHLNPDEAHEVVTRSESYELSYEKTSADTSDRESYED